MKILLVHNTYLCPGGEDVVFWQERRLLQNAGHEVIEYQRFNAEIEQYSTARRLTLLGRTTWASDSHRDFTALLRQHRPDIAHVHNTFPLISPSVLHACRNEKVPVVHTLHNYRLLCPAANFFRDGKPCEDCTRGSLLQSVVHGCYRGSHAQTAAVALMLKVHRVEKTWTRMVDRYIVLTEFARSRFVEAGFPLEKFVIRPNCVDPDPGQRTGEGKYALFVGRLSLEKGAHTLINAWRQLPAHYSLRVIGDGPSRVHLELLAASDGLTNVKFTGHLPRHQVIEAMKEARFLIFPSEQYENLPLTIIEAFACGIPVVASKLGAMQEVIEDGRTGIFFKPGDATDLARAATRAWEQPGYVQNLGQQARAEYERKYTAAANYLHLMEIYRSVVAAREKTGARLPMRDLQVPST